MTGNLRQRKHKNKYVIAYDQFAVIQNEIRKRIQMDKIDLKATLIKAHQETLQRLRDDYASYQSGSDLNLDEVRDADDNSHRETN